MGPPAFFIDTIQIDLTYRCNFGCPYCYNPPDVSTWKYNLKKEEISSVIDQALELGIRKFLFLGGEPTLHRDLAESIRYVRNRCSDAGTLVSTNGSRLDKDFIFALADAGLDTISFSIHLEPLNRDRQFDFGDLNKLLDDYIQRIRIAKNAGLTTYSTVAFTRQYYPFILTILNRLLAESPVDSVGLEYFFMAGHGAKRPDLVPTPQQVNAIYDDVRGLEQRYGSQRVEYCARHVYLEAGQRSHYTNPSLAVYNQSQIVVNPWGDVLPEPQATDALEVARLGNIKEEPLRVCIERYHVRLMEHGVAIQPVQ